MFLASEHHCDLYTFGYLVVTAQRNTIGQCGNGDWRPTLEHRVVWLFVMGPPVASPLLRAAFCNPKVISRVATTLRSQ